MRLLSKPACGKGIRDNKKIKIKCGSLSGRKMAFLFQGAAPEKWMLEAGDYTMSRFAGLYGMEYLGMAANKKEAKKLAMK